MKQKITLFFALIFVSFFGEAQTTLAAGDIAIIGVNYDTSPNYELTIVTLVPIAANTQIYISDYWYNESTPNKLTNVHANTGSALTSEGAILWQPTAAIPAGTVFKISILQGGNTVSGLPGNVTVTGWSTATGTPSNQGGDNWFIYQGTSVTDVTTFVFLFGNGSANTINNTVIVPGQFVTPNSFNTTWSTTNLGNNSVTYRPPSLTIGTNAIALTVDPAINGGIGYHADNNVYTGIKSGTKAAILTAICTIGNWSRDDINTYDITPGGTNFLGTNPIFTISSPNNPPTNITLSTSTVNENVAANTTVGTLSSTDADAANTFTYTLVAGTGDTDNASFNISGSNLRITASPDFENKASYSVRVRTTDQGSLTFEKAFTITINDLAEGVLLSTSPTLTFTQNSSDITGDNIASDGEGGSQSISDIDIQVYNISNTAGTLSTPLTWQNNSFLGSSSVSYTALTNPNNAGSKGMAIKSANGSEFKLNQFVYYNWGETQSLTNTVKGFRDGSEVASTTFEGYNSPYNPTTITLPSSFENVDEVRFYITAGGYMGNQSASNHSINSIKVSSPVANSAPTDITLSASAVNENVAANTTVGTLSSTDADAANTFTYTLVAGTGDTDNASFNISGNSLRITASPNFETKASYSVRVRTADQGGLTFEKVFTISITNVNEAPTDITLSASAVNENVAANTTVGTLSSTDADAANTFTYTLVAGAGDTDNASFNISGSNLRITASPNFETKASYSVRVRTADQGGLTFEKVFTISIINVNETPTDITLSTSTVNENVAANTTVGTLSSTDTDAANTFTYTLVAGTGDTDNASFNISGSNLRITASPNFETKSSYSVRVRTTDQGGLTFEKVFTISITNVNETPTDIVLSTSTVNENVAANTTVGTLSATDADAANTYTYTLVAGAGSTDNASFSISGNNLNETPTDIALSASSVNENVAANTTVGTLSSTDADAANTFTYTLVAGAGDTDNASFNISGNSLRITASPNFETKASYSVRVRTADQGGLTFEKAFTISITNVNETPTDIVLSTSTVNENVAANTTVGTLSSTDADAANTFTYTLVAGAGSTDNASFSISGTNLTINASPDFETKSSYSVRVRTTDQGSLTFEKAFTISINNLNETPTDIALSASSVNENVAANSTIGTLSSTDVDAANTFTYTLVAGTGSTDNAAFSISGSNLTINASPDFETKSSYSVRVRTTDQGSLFFEKTFTITVNDLCDLNNLVTLTSGVLTADQTAASYQWYKCSDNSLVGTNSNTYTPTVIGDYKVDITSGSCTVTSACVTVTTLGNTTFETNSKFVLYPNPSQGIINIQSDSDGDFQIVNQLGQIVKTFKVNANVLNSITTENLTDGLYFVKDSNTRQTHKLIIKK